MFEETGRIAHVNLTEKVYARLRGEILNGGLNNGQRLVSAEIADKFGVSVTPVRESLVRLEREGFVRSLPRRGAYVNTFTERDVKEVYDIREALEGVAARMSAESPNPELLKEMRQACDAYESGIKDNDPDVCMENDLRFHRLLAQASGSRRLVEVLESFHLQTISIAKKGADYWILAPIYLREHRSVVELISQGKSELAEERIKEHIRKGKERTAG